MKVVIDLPESIYRRAMEIYDKQKLPSIEAALFLAFEVGSHQILTGPATDPWELLQTKINELAPGTMFTVSRLLKNESPNVRKVMGRRMAAELSTATKYKIDHKNKAGTTHYIRIAE